MATKLTGTVIELSAPYTDGLQPHKLQKLGAKLVTGPNKTKYSVICSISLKGNK